MLSYCLTCRKNTESKNPWIEKIKNGRVMLLSNCAVCEGKKSRFIKEEEASKLLVNMLGTKIPVLGDISLANMLF